ncbi:MAG: carbamoyltransferase HypF, partial [Bacteroidales bacterium]
DRIPYRNKFSIVKSQNISENVTSISPDIAVCEQCLQEMETQQNRINYPFINCTNCGPRFTIIKELPYDRASTSMDQFTMCPDCYKEYTLITDRRFHAQPTACNNCGPSYYLTKPKKGNSLQYRYASAEKIFQSLAKRISAGEIISLKGLGGYNLICDAFNPQAIKTLRKIKQRDKKPFALMFRTIEKASCFARISENEKNVLSSWQRPIVLLNLHTQMDPNIHDGLKTVGVMLPYLPAHYLLFNHLNTDALVFTSGNLSDEPIIIDNQEAEKKLLPFCSLQIDHNREIVNRTDDSIVQVINDIPRIIRRSRGFVPTSHRSTFYLEGILALGAEKVNTFALGKENEAIMSQYIGDLKNKETLDFYEESIDRFQKLFRFTPTHIACDLHPDYFSTRKARLFASEYQLPLYAIQHHHAHAVACMEENHLRGKHLAVVLDGTGYGTDGKIWGGEFMICDHYEFERCAHFDYIPLPGGDKAVKEPWRMAVAFLDHYHLPIPSELMDNHHTEIELIRKMIDKKINSPESCGAGRIFDAVSSLLGCCDKAGYQAQAPLKLEHLSKDNYSLLYPIDERNPLSNLPMFEELTKEIRMGFKPELIAAKFHNTFVKQVITQIKQIRKEKSLPKEIVLSGGCFQNSRLLTSIEKRLFKEGLIPVSSKKYPVNDGGIALGQLSIAAALRKKNHA